jgi:hypothetical protein
LAWQPSRLSTSERVSFASGVLSCMVPTSITFEPKFAEMA